LEQKIIDSYFSTGLCGTCYRELPVTIEYRDNGSAYMTKTCPEHGYQEYMIEKDYKFWAEATQKNPNNQTWHHYNKTTLVEVTDRCNVQCKHCYHMPDNTIPDKSVDHILKISETAFTQSICLAGAEPTMRDDLTDIISGIRKIPWMDEYKTVSIYTNGIKLQKTGYVEKLAKAGLHTVNMSVHHPEYHKDNVWQHVSKALIHVANCGIDLGQISFTVENKKELNYAVDKMLWLMEKGRNPTDFCVRSPAEIGVPYESDGEIFASDIAKWFYEIADERGLKFEKHPNHGSNPYHVGHLLEGKQTIQIIHWANVKTVDTSYMYMGPWAIMMPNTWGTFLIQAIMRDGVRKGWYQGHRIAAFNSTNIGHNSTFFDRLIRKQDLISN
jgi:hypothetical protein